MLKFTIPTEYCLIINAFNQTSSLRGAASLLGVDAPSLVRKVRKISLEFGYLEKAGNRWIVTESGRRVAQWTDEMIQSQSEMAQIKSSIRISSFAWLAEEMLIPNYPHLKILLKKDQTCTFKTTAANLEQELLQSRTDIVIQGHAPNDPTISYKKISSYNWVVVAPYSWKKSISNLSHIELIKFMNKKPFIRYLNLNPENLLKFSPNTMANITVDGVIGIRSAVVSGEGWSVLPAMSVHKYIKDKKMISLEIDTHIKDEVSVWWVRSRKDLTESVKLLTKWVSEFKLD
jgi:DNA-binding transcriptional LysR family regulator